jgi:hypothetical protein
MPNGVSSYARWLLLRVLGWGEEAFGVPANGVELPNYHQQDHKQHKAHLLLLSLKAGTPRRIPRPGRSQYPIVIS